MKKNWQHYIPRVYLKHFQIDEVQNKSFVYCIDFSNKFVHRPQRKGLNDVVFKEKKFYNDHRLTDSYAIENVLGEDFEPKYDKIIDAIKSEKPLSNDIIENLITWLYISKMRSPILRLSAEQFLTRHINLLQANRKIERDEQERKTDEEYIGKLAKEVHLNPFSDMKQATKLIELFESVLKSKHWRVWKSPPAMPFCTNDNPGFSPNVDIPSAQAYPFHHIIELNPGSYIYYVLTPFYCLEISPFSSVTPVSVNAMNMEIKFEQASLEFSRFINNGVFQTRIKLLISNSKKLLDSCISKSS